MNFIEVTDVELKNSKEKNRENIRKCEQHPELELSSCAENYSEAKE